MPATATAEGNPVEFDLEGASPEVLTALLKGDTSLPGQPAPAPQAPAVETPEASATPEATPETTPEAPPAETDPEETPEGDQLPKFRLRPADYQEAEVFRLVKEGVSLRDATERVYGKPEPAKPEAKPEAPADPYATEEAKIRAEIADLEKQAEKAESEVDVKEIRRIALEQMRRERALERIEDRRAQDKRDAEARQQAEQQAKAQTAEQQDYQAALEKYPVLADKNSKDRLAFNGFHQQALKDASLKPILDLPNWRTLLADIAAARGIIAPKAATPVAQVTPSAPKPAATQVSPRPPNASTVLTSRGATPPAQSFEITKEQVEQDIATMPKAVLDALLKGQTAAPSLKRK